VLAVGHVYHHQSATGAKHAPELAEHAWKIRLRQQVEHVVVDQDVETVFCEIERISIADTQAIVRMACLRRPPFRTGKHRIGQIDALIPAGRIHLENSFEREPRPDGHLEHGLAVLYRGQFEASFASPAFGEPGPRIVK
jgi:hypothetical protein